MAATDPKRAAIKQILIVAALWGGLIGAFQNCAVELSPSTPGAKNSNSGDCALSTAESAAFEAVLNDILQATAGAFASGKPKCGTCHNPGGLGAGSFTVFNGNTTTTPSLIQKNACSVIDFGKIVATHPQQGSHGGGAYPASDIQALINWVNQYVP